MPAKIKINLRFNKFLPDTKKVFTQLMLGREGEDVKNKIKDLIAKGISPVFGVGRLQKYSESYVAQMKGEIDFRTLKTGRKIKSGGGFSRTVIPIFPEDGGILDTLPRAFGKKPRPVNLYLSGTMMESLTVLRGVNNPIIAFTDKVAIYHNEMGAGRSKVIRRVLPTYEGELFNTAVQRLINATVAKAIRLSTQK